MSFLDDVRYAARALARAPIFTLIVVVTLALGIGANAAVFTVVNAVLIKKLPYADPDRLVAIRLLAPDAPRFETAVPSPAFAAWAEHSRTMERVAAYNVGDKSVRLPTGETFNGATVSPNLFSTLGLSLGVGRPFVPEDAAWGAPPVAIVSHAFWRDYLGAPQNLAGVRVPGSQTAVVGVMPESFQFPDVIAPDILVPLRIPDVNSVVASVHVLARIRSRTSVDVAQLELAQIVRAGQPAFPSAMAPYLRDGARLEVMPLRQRLAGDFGRVLLIAFCVAGAVLLIACANVAGLLLARITGRERELTIRIALGGTPVRLARLLLTESVMLATAGVGAAVLTVQWSLPTLRQALVGTAPYVETIAIDVRVAMFTVLAGLVSGLFCTAIPIGRVLARRRRWDWKIGPSSTGVAVRHGAHRALVIGQVSAAVLLLVGSLLLLGTLWRLTNANVGFNPGDLLTLRVPRRAAGWSEPPTASLDEILRRIGALPGVVSAAATTSFPLDGHGFKFSIAMEGQPPSPVEESNSTGVDIVSPEYFHAMGIRVLSGRTFVDADTSTAPRVAIVNEAFVRWKKLNDADALGRRLGLSLDPQYANTTIVGVVDNVKDKNPGDAVQPIVYKPFTQAAPNIGWSEANFVVRTAPDAVSESEPVRQAIAAVLPNAIVRDVQPMERRIAILLAPQRQRAVIFGLFGVTAVALTAVGLYGLLAYIVSQQMREFGIRLAIGSSRTQLLWLVLRRGLLSASIGLVVGLAGARLVTRVLAGMLYGVTATDPMTFVAAAAIMLAVAAIASYAPARRAMRADPLTVLRSE